MQDSFQDFKLRIFELKLQKETKQKAGNNPAFFI